MSKDVYYARPEVSNSDLSWMAKYWMPAQRAIDLEKAYAFGSLIDAMITEPTKLDYFKFTCEGYQHTREDFDKANLMKKAFMADPFCVKMYKQCQFQKVSVVPKFEIEYNGWKFWTPARAKWDLFCDAIDLGGDIKSTTATTQAQCEALISYFDYDRSRAWYMDLEGRTNDVLIFISKVNFKIFKVFIKKGDPIYNAGKAKYQELAFRWLYLFGDLENQLIAA